jgi:hypothetical protein
MLGIMLHAPRSPFYRPKAARSRWSSNWKCNSCLLSGGVPDSLVHHQTWTVAVWCPISFLIRRSRPLDLRSHWRTEHCLVHTGQSGVTNRPLAQVALAHRTVMWILATTPLLFPESDEFVVGPAWAPDNPVHHRLVLVWLDSASFSPIQFLLTWQDSWHLDKYISTQKQFTKVGYIPCSLIRILTLMNQRILCWASNHQNIL